MLSNIFTVFSETAAQEAQPAMLYHILTSQTWRKKERFYSEEFDRLKVEAAEGSRSDEPQTKVKRQPLKYAEQFKTLKSFR